MEDNYIVEELIDQCMINWDSLKTPLHWSIDQTFKELYPSWRLHVSIEDFKKIHYRFIEKLKLCVDFGELDDFQTLMDVEFIFMRTNKQMEAVIVQLVINALMSLELVDWIRVVYQCSNPTTCVNEKLMPIWTRKRYDLVQICFRLSRPCNELLRLNLKMKKAILKSALQEKAGDDMLNSVIDIAKYTDFLTFVLQLEDKQTATARRNLVDHIFMHLNVLELHQEQMKLLSMCSKREVVFGKTLLEAALQGSVCPLPESLQMLTSLNETFFGVLDLEFLVPMFSENQFLRCIESSMARDARDVVILLIRSGLLHQFGSWLKTKLEECSRKGYSRCKYCDVSSYLVNSSVPDGPAIQQLLLQSGFLPNRLLFQLSDILPEPPQPSSSIPVGEAVSDDSDEVDFVPVTDRRPPPPPPTSSSTYSSPKDMNSVVKAFVQQPYSLLTMAAAKVSTMIGSHCGRSGRIGQLPVPKLVQDHVAFRAGDFKLACEKEAENSVLTPVDNYTDDIDDNIYYEDEDGDDDDGYE